MRGRGVRVGSGLPARLRRPRRRMCCGTELFRCAELSKLRHRCWSLRVREWRGLCELRRTFTRLWVFPLGKHPPDRRSAPTNWLDAAPPQTQSTGGSRERRSAQNRRTELPGQSVGDGDSRIPVPGFEDVGLERAHRTSSPHRWHRWPGYAGWRGCSMSSRGALPMCNRAAWAGRGR